MAKIAQVIKYEGDDTAFIWKHPCEDFNTLSQLIVHEGQEAILFRDGQALDLFGPGRYTLETQNIPMLGKGLKKITGGATPFQCQVYFINTTSHMSIKWGTDSKVRFLEPELGIPLEIGACGEMDLRITNGRRLLLKLVGTMSGIAWEEEGSGFTKSLKSCFRPLISTAVKTELADSIRREKIDILEVDRHLMALSEDLRRTILPGFEDYGLTISRFYITNVLLPETDPNFRRMRELRTVTMQTRTAEAEATIVAAERKAELERQATKTEIARQEAERELIRAQVEAQSVRLAGMAEAEVMRAKGYSQRDVLQAEVQKAYAEGLGSMTISGGGGVTGDMIGLGVGLAAAGAVSGQVGEMFKGIAPQPVGQPTGAVCAKCGSQLPEGSKFCLNCGERVVAAIPEGMVVCPDCGETVHQGKFCPACGHRFVTVCPNCGGQLPAGAKFCLECGQKL